MAPAPEPARAAVIYEEPILAGRPHPGLAAMGRAITEKQREEAEAAKELTAQAAGKVPWSRRAAFLATLVAALLQTALMIGSKDPKVEIFPGFGITLAPNASVAGIAAVAGVLRGARIAAISLALGHRIAEAFKSGGLLDYTLICGVIGALTGCLFAQRSGADIAHIKLALISMKGDTFALIATEAGTAAAAGFIYRLVAARRG